jgi:hypothetical protein
LNIQIALTEQEIRTFAIRMNIVNQQQEQLTKLTQELQLNRETLNAIWKSIYQRWQLEKPEERIAIKFLENTEVKFENGAISCIIPDELKKKGDKDGTI